MKKARSGLKWGLQSAATESARQQLDQHTRVDWKGLRLSSQCAVPPSGADADQQQITD